MSVDNTREKMPRSGALRIFQNEMKQVEGSLRDTASAVGIIGTDWVVHLTEEDLQDLQVLVEDMSLMAEKTFNQALSNLSRQRDQCGRESKHNPPSRNAYLGQER